MGVAPIRTQPPPLAGLHLQTSESQLSELVSRFNSMDKDPRKCRENARECLEMARRSPNPRLAEKLNKIAQGWIIFATDLEAAQRMVEEQKYVHAADRVVVDFSRPDK
jgi:hypothetical protein